MDAMEKYDVTDEDVAVLYELLDRMQKSMVRCIGTF